MDASWRVGGRKHPPSAHCAPFLVDHLALWKRWGLAGRTQRDSTTTTGFVAGQRTTELSLSRHWRHDEAAATHQHTRVKRKHFFAIVKCARPEWINTDPCSNRGSSSMPIASP